MDRIREFINDPKNNIYIHHQSAVEDKIAYILKNKDKLSVISDFDMTMTKYWHNGQRSTSTHGVMESYSEFPTSFREENRALYEQYYPIEVNHELSLQDKIPHMEKWWTRAHELIIDVGVYKDDITNMCKEHGVIFRDGLSTLLDTCCAMEIPFLVFSAGIQDVIHELLVQENLYKENMHIVSNKMEYDESGRVVGFGKLIHVFNKNESAVEDLNFKKLIQDKDVVIVIGDSLGDLGMSSGIEHSLNLTIGYLNHDQELLMDAYASAFDVVILGDSSLDFVNLLISLL